MTPSAENRAGSVFTHLALVPRLNQELVDASLTFAAPLGVSQGGGGEGEHLVCEAVLARDPFTVLCIVVGQ